MSMICYLLSLSPGQMGVLRASPGLAGDLARVAQDDARAARRAEVMRSLPADKRAEAEAQDRAFRSQPLMMEAESKIAASLARLAPFGDLEPALCLEKSWHMLHYLFTGSIGPIGGAGDALLTGEDIGDDAGYGPPRLHLEKATQEFALFLSALDGARLAERMSFKEMSAADVYAMPMGRGAEQEEPALRAEVAHFFPLLRDYVVAGSEKAHGLLTWIS